jgi:uncharacterized Zn finger protein
VEHAIANILHRNTIAVIVGRRTFERGEQCFASGRVVTVEGTPGELRGVVRPQELGRVPYRVRIWVREEGVAYECTCPIGERQEFCKHTVAIALAHLDRERRDAEQGLAVLREALGTVAPGALIDGLIMMARHDAALADDLKRLCLEALARQ